MEPESVDNLNEENILSKYQYLESLLKSYSSTYDKKSISLNEYFIHLHRVVFRYQNKSNKSDVEMTENFFQLLIKNSLKLDINSILFKSLSYFIQNGFDLFINVLKSDKVTTKKEFNNLLLGVLDTVEIGKKFKIFGGEIENTLNIKEFKKAMTKVKFKNKIMCFIMFFFRKFIQEEKDQILLEEIKKYIEEKNISSFYQKLDEEIEEKNNPENIENVDKNEIKGESFDYDDKKENIDNSSNKEKDMTETGMSEDTNLVNYNLSKELLDINNTNERNNKPLNNEEMQEMILKLSKEVDDLKKKVDKVNALEKNVEDLNKGMKLLDQKLSISLLINNLYVQRDSYKKALEILLKRVITEFKLNIKINETIPLWKRTKEIINAVAMNSKDMEKQKIDRLEKGLTSLLFCKDYSNFLVHGKGKFSEAINKYYKNKDSTPFINVASYKNMKDVTIKFFSSTVNEFEEFKVINSIILDKMEDWEDDNDLNYMQYFTEDGLDCEEIISDFNYAVEIMETLKLSKEIDLELEN